MIPTRESHGRPRGSGVTFGLLGLAFAFGGCGGLESAAPVGENVQANGAGAAAAPAASTPLAEPKPAAADVLTPEGFGPLRIGMSRAEVVQAMGEDSNPEAVGGPDPESCDEFRPARAPKGMLVMIEKGRLTRISLGQGATTRTDRGIGIGATADAVRAAYGPGTTITQPHKYAPPPGEYITYWAGGPRKGYVQDPAARGIVHSIEQTRRVGQIHAGGPSVQYVEGCL